MKKALLGVIAATMAISAVSAAPAMAAGTVATTRIGSLSAVGLSNTYTGLNGKTAAIVTTANFSNHTTNSVKLVSFRVCYSGGAGAVLISPYTRNSGGSVWESGPYKQVNSGTCQSWTVNKVYTKQADNEVVRVVNRVSDSGGKYTLIAGYLR